MPADEAREIGFGATLSDRLSLLQKQPGGGHEAETLLRVLLAAVPDNVLVLDHELNIRFTNRVVPGLPLERLLGSSVLDYVTPEEREPTRLRYQRSLDTGEPERFELRSIAAYGQPADYEINAVPIPAADGQRWLLVAALDITSRVARERELAESEARLRVAVDATGLAMWSWNLITDEVTWSPRMYELFGRSEPLKGAKYIQQVVHPDDREQVEREVAESKARGEMRGSTHRIVRPDGGVRWVMTLGSFMRDETGQNTKIVGGTFDITPQRTLEEQLRHAQKMEAVGQLAAGIAHNFNNMLAGILPVLELSRPHTPPSRQPLLDDALQAGERAAEMVRQLMTFAGHERDHRRTTQLVGPIVQRALAMCQRLFDRRIEVQLHNHAARARVAANASQLEQALINVLLNARDAVLDAAQEQPLITLAIDVVERSAVRLLLQPGLAAPAYVRLRVTDNGIGMSEAVRRRVFEPFFTTKDPGRGTGLGLSTTFGIVHEHAGVIGCDPAPGGGTRFELYLPLAEHEEPVEPVPTRSERVRGSGQKVLVVDDEPSVREVTALVLEDAGYVAL